MLTQKELKQIKTDLAKYISELRAARNKIIAHIEHIKSIDSDFCPF